MIHSSSSRPKIVVLTPIKNEAWILERFLTVTSRFADLIIIADQDSTDESLEICKRFPKVALVRNSQASYDEAGRQKLLIQEARGRISEPKILLALDADEILAADAISAQGWQTMLQAKPGTVLCFEKPDLFLGTRYCIRYDTPWPLGYVDDGAAHTGKKVHSIRIPTPPGCSYLNLHDIKILHYNMCRPSAIDSRRRFYAVQENIEGLNPFWRRIIYSNNVNNWRLNLAPLKNPTLPGWFLGWEAAGIDMHSIFAAEFYWWDLEILKAFQFYGSTRFWFDDIWDFDWARYTDQISTESSSPVRLMPPPKILQMVVRTTARIVRKAASIRRKATIG
jgi:glycosyltransferase involved in cell wall biosynthesis